MSQIKHSPSDGKIRVAVIGTGNMGKNHVRNYFLLPEADLVGISDVNEQARTLAKEYKTKYFSDYKQMLDEVHPDAVSVVVPTPFHFEIAKEVMGRGIHCLLEKPIASTVEQANQLIECAQENRVIFTVGHIEHYNPLVIALKKLLDKKIIGEVTSVVCKRVGGFPAIEPKTDVIIDLAVHDIGIISHLLAAKPKQVFSHGSRTYHSKKIDSAEMLIDYGHASGFVQANWLTPVKIRTVAVTGSKGYVEGNYITQELVYYEHNVQKIKNEEGSLHEFIFKVDEPKKRTVAVEFEEPLAQELKAFLSHTRGKRESYLVSPQEATEALRLALEAIGPYQEGGER